MEWLSKEQIHKAAKESLVSAIKMSIWHHRQIKRATKKEFIDGIKKREVDISTAFCALCIRKLDYNLESVCPLNTNCRVPSNSYCCKEWRCVSNSFACLFFYKDGTKKALNLAEEKLIARLEKVLADAQKTKSERKKIMQILERYSEKVIFASQHKTMKETVVDALWNGADLSEANLFEVDLSKADLSYANLSDASLIEANLSEANLREINLENANLIGADLSNADLRGADLSNANLRRANLSNANLFEASLNNADLAGADLTGANLEDINLKNTNLHRAKISYRGRVIEISFAEVELER